MDKSNKVGYVVGANMERQEIVFYNEAVCIALCVTHTHFFSKESS